MDDLIKLLGETGIPFAYDHFAEGESPDPPFICYLLPQSDNFSAGREGLSEGQQCEYRTVHRQQGSGCGTEAGSRAGYARYFL